MPEPTETGLSEPIQPRVPVPLWRWVAAVLLAPTIFLLVVLVMAVLLGQTMAEVPGRYIFVVIVAQVALPLAVTVWATRRLLRPKPRRQRGFAAIQTDDIQGGSGRVSGGAK